MELTQRPIFRIVTLDMFGPEVSQLYTTQAGGNALGSPLVTLKSGTSNPVGGVILEPPLQEILNCYL